MQQKIIIFLILVFFISSGWLFQSSEKFMNPNEGKNWWSIEFQNPKSDSLNFILKSHADTSDFHLEVLQEETKILEDNFKITKGEQKEINLDDQLNVEKKGRLIIQVNAGGEKRELYKNF